MSKLLIVLFFVGCPMALTQLLYRIVDHKGNKTKLLTDRFPILKEKKILFQICVPMIFILFFGVIGVACHMSVKLFLIIIGVFVGIVNGMAITIMYNE